MQNQQPLKIFIAFANEDRDVRDKLLAQMNLLKTREHWDIWASHEIKAGSVWNEEIKTRLSDSEIVVLLMSSNFFNSNYILDIELPAIIEKHRNGNCHIIPVLAKKCLWKDTPFGDYIDLGKIQALPSGERPIVSKGAWDSDDDPYVETVLGIKESVRGFRIKRAEQDRLQLIEVQKNQKEQQEQLRKQKAIDEKSRFRQAKKIQDESIERFPKDDEQEKVKVYTRPLPSSKYYYLGRTGFHKSTLFILLGFVLLLILAWFVPYPAVVTSDKLSITTAEPPVDVLARTDGKVTQLLVSDTDSVVAKQPLAVLQNTARYADVHRLDLLVTKWQKLATEDFRQLQYPDSLSLGELQSDYTLFVRDLKDFKFGRENRSTSVQSNIGSIQLQIKQLEQSIAFEQKVLKRSNEDLKIAEEFYARQKDLFKQGLISEIKLDEERQKLSDIANERDRHENNVLEKNREIIDLRNKISSANFNQQENSRNSSSRLLASLNGLRSGIDKWMQTYVISAPIGGRVVFNSLTLQQFVRTGETVMTIVPQNQGEIVGRVLLAVEKSGKVIRGQHVVMKLDNYPYQEFGTISGRVIYKSAMPKGREYTIIVDKIQVSSSGKLITSFQKEIPFEQQLLGIADIITDDKGFLEHVLEQVTSGFKP